MLKKSTLKKNDDVKGLDAAYSNINGITRIGNTLYIGGTGAKNGAGHLADDMISDLFFIPTRNVHLSERYKDAMEELRKHPDVSRIVGHSLAGAMAREINRRSGNRYATTVYSSPLISGADTGGLRIYGRSKIHAHGHVFCWFLFPSSYGSSFNLLFQSHAGRIFLKEITAQSSSNLRKLIFILQLLDRLLTQVLTLLFENSGKVLQGAGGFCIASCKSRVGSSVAVPHICLRPDLQRKGWRRTS